MAFPPPLPHEENAGIFTNDIPSHEDIINTDDYLSLEDSLSVVDGDWRLNLPPGMKFRPTDEELITYYLKNYSLDRSFDDNATHPITYADIYNFEPHQLLELGKDHGDGKRYLYSWIKKNGYKTERIIKSKKGSWKPTQAAKPITDQNGITIGYKRPLAYHQGGKKTLWLMQEFQLQQESHSSSHHSSHYQLVLAVVYYHPRTRRHHHSTKK